MHRREQQRVPAAERSTFAWFAIAIVLLAAWFRFHDLRSAPPGLSQDEAMNGVNAMEAIKDGKIQVFYPENHGREGLFINTQALVLWTLGAGRSGDFRAEPWMLRVTSAVFGVLTVAGILLLARILLASDFAALTAGFLTATSFWHINFSRLGFRAISAPFWLVWSLYFLLLGFRLLERGSKKRGLIVLGLAGLCCGAGFHSYISYRVTPVLFAVALVWMYMRMTSAGNRSGWWMGAMAFGAAAILAAAPLLLYFAGHPGSFSGRSGEVSILRSASPVGELLWNGWKAMLMFNVEGDPHWRHNVSGRPELFLPAGVLFLLGIGISVRRVVKGWRNAWPYLLCLVWVAIGVLPAVLSNEQQPHALRSIVAIPGSFLLAGIGADQLRQWTRRESLRLVAVIVAFLMVAVCYREAYTTYFETFVRDPHLDLEFEPRVADLGRQIRSAPAAVPKYVLMPGVVPDARGNPPDAYSMVFLSGGFNAEARNRRNIHFIYSPAEAERAARIPGALVFRLN